MKLKQTKYIESLVNKYNVHNGKLHSTPMETNLKIEKTGEYIWGKIRQVYPPENFLSPISLKVRKIIVLMNRF